MVHLQLDQEVTVLLARTALAEVIALLVQDHIAQVEVVALLEVILLVEVLLLLARTVRVEARLQEAVGLQDQAQRDFSRKIGRAWVQSDPRH